MIDEKQQLKEEWYGDLNKSDAVFKNPNPSEVKEVVSNMPKSNRGVIRAFVDRGGLGDLYIFTSEETHTGFLRKFSEKIFKGTYVPLYIHTYHQNKVTWSFDASDERYYREYKKWELKNREKASEPGITGWGGYDEWMYQTYAKPFWSKNLKNNVNMKRIRATNITSDLYDAT